MRKWIGVILLQLAAGLACAESVLPDRDADVAFLVISALPAAELAALEGRRISFAVDLENSPGFSLTQDTDSLALLYRMSFNNIAEGWSWEPQADREVADYYRFKFLPLKSVQEEKGAPVEVELYPGKTLKVGNQWRYDYFLAFENLYDFYPRKVDDDSGFSAAVKLGGTAVLEKSRLKMQAIGRLKPPFHSESNTFWKADFADPVDLTLRKRYLIVELEEIRFVDGVSGQVYAYLLQSKP